MYLSPGRLSPAQTIHKLVLVGRSFPLYLHRQPYKMFSRVKEKLRETAQPSPGIFLASPSILSYLPQLSDSLVLYIPATLP